MHESVLDNLNNTRSFVPCKRSRSRQVSVPPAFPALAQEFDASATDASHFSLISFPSLQWQTDGNEHTILTPHIFSRVLLLRVSPVARVCGARGMPTIFQQQTRWRGSACCQDLSPGSVSRVVAAGSAGQRTRAVTTAAAAARVIRSRRAFQSRWSTRGEGRGTSTTPHATPLSCLRKPRVAAKAHGWSGQLLSRPTSLHNV